MFLELDKNSVIFFANFTQCISYEKSNFCLWTPSRLYKCSVLNFWIFQVNFENNLPTECFSLNVGMCRLGDLVNRLGTLSIAGRKVERDISRKMFTDTNLPLSGHNNILGKSLVIYDDFGPVARGERLACSMLDFFSSSKNEPIFNFSLWQNWRLPLAQSSCKRLVREWGSVITYRETGIISTIRIRFNECRSTF